MKLIIDIDENIYNHIVVDSEYFTPSLVNAFKNGTPLDDVLNKIRAEIEQITDTMGVSYNQYVSKIDVFQILDKYKAERSDKE